MQDDKLKTKQQKKAAGWQREINGLIILTRKNHWFNDRSPLEHKLHILPSLAAGTFCPTLGSAHPRLNARGPLPVGQEQFGSIWRKSEVRGPEQVASRSTGPVGGVLEPRSRALLYPQEAGRAQRVCPRLHPSCPLRPGRAVSTTRGRAQDSRNAAGLRAHRNASVPLLAPNAEGLCPERSRIPARPFPAFHNVGSHRCLREPSP